MSEGVKPKIFRPKKRINRKTKTNLVFNAEARREFLTGFKKRKRQRQKKAKEELEQRLKEEKKRIRDEARNLKEKFPVSHRPIPELEEMLTTSEQTIDFPEHSVSIKELVAPEIKANKEKSEEEKEDEEKNPENPSPFKGKNLKTEIRKLAAKQHRKSKLVQAKTKMERIKNKKRSQRHKKSGPKDKRSKHRGKTQNSKM